MAFYRNVKFWVESENQKKQIDFFFNHMINAGFSGRDQKTVWDHILELEKEGIPGPKTTPVFFSLTCNNLLFNDIIQVGGHKTSGEVEFVMCIQNDKTYIGIGSDHTDRALEQFSMPNAKEICPNIMSDVLWDYDEIKNHWDEIEISSYTREQINSKDILYQKGKLSNILHPNELKEIVKKQLIQKDLTETVIFSGTIPIVTSHTIYGEYFACKLFDPILNRSLNCNYEIQKINNIFIED